MVSLIGFGISVAVFLIIWIITMIRDRHYSSLFGESPTEVARILSIFFAFVVAFIAPFFIVILWRPYGAFLGIVLCAFCFVVAWGMMKKEVKRRAVIRMISFLALSVIFCIVIAFSFREIGLRLVWLGGAAIIALIMTGLIPLLRETY